MNVLRSPSNTGGGSQPDLSKITNMETDSTITFRKRKNPFEHDCKCTNELKELRSELSRMSLLLEKYTDSNKNIMTKMQESIVEVKTQIVEMKETTETTNTLIHENITQIKDQIIEMKSSAVDIITEQNNIKEQVAILETKLTVSDRKVKTIEDNISKQLLSVGVEGVNHLNEELIREVQERSDRERNIIILGLPEQTTPNAKDRLSKDTADVIKITHSIAPDVPNPLKVIRIGKYCDTKIRKVKVYYESKSSAKQLLRNRENLSKGIKIYSDQTPNQQIYLQNLKEEMTRRNNEGEEDLTIKYIKGIPKIVKNNKSKNYHK